MWEEARLNFSSGAYGDPQSLETLKMFWQTMLRLSYPGAKEALEYINDAKCMFFLLGNKSDLKEEIKINEEDIRAFMKKNQKIKQYFEVSALNGHNIDLAFDKIAQYLILTFGVEEINKNIKVYKMNLNSHLVFSFL